MPDQFYYCFVHHSSAGAVFSYTPLMLLQQHYPTKVWTSSGATAMHCAPH